MLTESQVERSFNRLLATGERTEELFERAEQLLESLRPESPLRHRLAALLDELRQTALSEAVGP